MVVSVMLLLVALSTHAFGQGANASLSGTVQDASQAVLPGATVTATNSATGVQIKSTTNNAGIYSMGGLQPGTYKVTAEMAGFQTSSKTDVRLDLGAQIRLNFEMKVAGVATQIEVSSSVQDMILEASSTTGTVLQEKTITSLPNMNNDMMELINVMGGVVRNDSDSVFGNTTQTFAGVGTSNINVQRDGITVNDVRFNTGNGIVSPGRLDPEMVSEFKLVLTPVDAEMGRGAGQVQVLTKSGTNAYHGSALWSLMNTGIDANEWNNNKNHTIPNWRNANEYTLSASGPIIKNKTFFFVTWDQAIVRQKQTVRSPVLTNCARKGIYRYFSGWIPGNTAYSTTPGTAGTQSRPSIDANGNPLVPTTNGGGGAYTGTGNVPSIPGLNFYSVLGQLTSAAQAQILADPVNCSQYADLAAGSANGIVSGSNWDPFRKQFDTTGYIGRFTAMMPKANDFYSGGLGGWGDGLNVADLKWTRTTPGQDTVYGVGEDNARKSITAKIDHNLSSKNRLSGTFSYEKDTATDGENTWPTPLSYGGNDLRKPITFTASFTSTLRPTLLNEARVGLAYNESHTLDATEGDNSKQILALLQQLMPTSSWSNWKGLPVVIGPGNGYVAFTPDSWSVFGEYTQMGLWGNSLFQLPAASNPFGSRGNFPSSWGDHDYRWTFADTLTWTKGAHSFRGGAQYLVTHANMDQNGWGQFSYSSNTFPFVQGGDTGIPASFPSGLGNLPGMTGYNFGFMGYTTGTYQTMYQMMDYFAGSIGTVRQYYFANSPTQKVWNDPAAGQTVRYLDGRQNELSMFFKDDWKASSSLTLNLGLRWDYYGVPWIANGMSVGLVGGAPAIFGGSAGGFSSWLQNPAFNSSNLTTQQFMGPGSPNPGQSAYNKDYTSFGPAAGFAWQLPWFGKGKTTLRGGYQVSFVPATPSSDPNGGYESVIGNVPGTIYPISYSGSAAVNSGYMDLSMLQSLIPVGNIPGTGGNTLATMITPLSVRPTTDRSQTLSVYDPNLRNPYIQSLTLALTRNVGSNVTVDARYIGTFSRKLVNTLALNSANWINNQLLNAFTLARAGQDSPLLDKLIAPGTLAAGNLTGTQQLVSNQGTTLSQGAFASLAGTLANTNGVLPLSSSVKGGVLRYSGTPENFVYTNPQFSGAGWISNLDNSNYHSLQAQVTLRPTHNLNFQATYTWSRNLGNTGAGTNPLNRQEDYGLLGSSREHNLTTYGTYVLPLGTNGYLFRDSSKAVKRVVEGWQVSWISYVYSGTPGSISDNGVSSMWAGPSVNSVNGFNPSSGHVSWASGAANGYYFGNNKYMQVPDPQCSNTSVVAASMAATCNTGIKALALIDHYDANGNPVAGNIVLEHALPGTVGNMDTDNVIGPGKWGLDATLGKNIQITEGKSLNIRIDAQDVFNHPTPSGTAPSSYNSRQYSVGNPIFDIGSTTQAFGLIPYKGGHRVFSAKVRLTF